MKDRYLILKGNAILFRYIGVFWILMLDSVQIKYSILLKLVTVPDQNLVYLGYEKVDIHSY